MIEKCPYHDKLAEDVTAIDTKIALLQKDVEYLRRDIEAVLSRIGKHVEEAERPGGRHDRMNKAESDIEALRTAQQNDRIMGRWFMIGSGIIGGLLGSGSASAVSKFLGLWG